MINACTDRDAAGHTSADALVERLTSSTAPPSFALLCRDGSTLPKGERTVDVLLGTPVEVDDISSIPFETASIGSTDPVGGGPRALALVPFRQIRERGFECRDDGTSLQVLIVEEAHVLAEGELRDALPDNSVEVVDGGFDLDDAAYAEAVERIVHDEIAPGRGANFVIRRDFTARLSEPGLATVLTLFRRLLTGENGAYWTFCVHIGSDGADGSPRTLVGASPEAHVRFRDGEVVMNPISGTYRYPSDGPNVEGVMEFLADTKERDELAMVVDEELKMLSAVADHDIRLRGPYLREMSRLAHTEFEIRGRGVRDLRDVLASTMFAATVTGSPLESACRVIQNHEPSGRGYYAGALALFGSDADGAPWLDSPILIRTADVAKDGRLRIPVGATLVRDSVPHHEVAETHAKLDGILSALGVTGSSLARSPSQPSLNTPDVLASLARRRSTLAPFWLEPSSRSLSNGSNDHVPAVEEVLVVDAEDEFTTMLAHVLRAAAVRASVVPYDSPDLPSRLAECGGPILLGPGPGNPNDVADERISALTELTADVLRGTRTEGPPVVGVCLGFQLLANVLGLPVVQNDRPFQGTQRTVDFFDGTETLGFYNSFSVRASEAQAAALSADRGVVVSRNGGTDEVTALRGPRLAGVQFHPESVLSLRGPEILLQLLHGVSTAARVHCPIE